MLFHSVEFLFILLPVVYLGWLLFARAGRFRMALAWVTLGSFVFYGYWNPPYLLLLLGSIAGNFSIGKLVDPALGRPWRQRFGFLTLGVSANLLALGYFKYANFFVDTINRVFDSGWTLANVLLPLAISFFTFQQIAYLVDSYRGIAKGHSFLDYCFFVSFFPQLIAGPIVHHSEILPQLAAGFRRAEAGRNLLIGLSIFAVGLFKKMVLADPCGELATAFFDGVADGRQFPAADAWCGVFGYTFQIYFDFSGYSDMAIGLARMFGLRLPQNFAAPYRATNIVEFWRRWHITLSRFLRDYLYIPLGGNRRGAAIRYRNLLITMLLGGLWHGAGWTFVVWGALHGCYLMINHAWDAMLHKRQFPAVFRVGRAATAGGWLITMLAVVFAWVFFRADSMATALSVLQSMFDPRVTGVAPPLPGTAFLASPLRWPWLVILAGLALLAPTTQNYFARVRPTFESSARPVRWWQWKPGFVHGVIFGLMLVVVLRRYFSLAPTEFLYFNF